MQLFRKLVDPADPAQVDNFYQEFKPSIPLERALLCLNCDSIFEAVGAQVCPSCGSEHSWSIAKALNRRAA